MSAELADVHDDVRSRRITFWTHQPPNFSTYSFVLNPKVALPQVSDTELLGVTDDAGHAAISEGSSRMRTRVLVFKPAQALADTDVIAKQQQLQLSVATSIASLYGYTNRSEQILCRVSRAAFTIDHLELYFKDQYIGRSDMWRVANMLLDQCVYVSQKIQLPSGLRATIGKLYIDGERTQSGYIAPSTKTIFRSESAKYDLFIQMSKEMWEFDEGGEIYYEKILQGFLPDLLRKWEAISPNHVVSVILFTRVFYTEEEQAKQANLPVQQDAEGQFYADYYKVIVDLESNCNWPAVVRTLKEEFFRFQHDILLQPRTTQHAAPLEGHNDGTPTMGRVLVGEIAHAHRGNVLEAINLALNPYDQHYVDRDLTRTGFEVLIATAGTGSFFVDKRLLRTTTQRMAESGISLDLVCLTQMPLHTAPIFQFRSAPLSPDARHCSALRRSIQSETETPLYTDNTAHPNEMHTYYFLPYWINCSFYHVEQDMHFRSDRFVPRCRMDGLRLMELMGSGRQDLLIPYIHMKHEQNTPAQRRTARDMHDTDIFRPQTNGLSAPSFSKAPPMAEAVSRTTKEKRDAAVERSSFARRVRHSRSPNARHERHSAHSTRRSASSRTRTPRLDADAGYPGPSRSALSLLFDTSGKGLPLVAETVTELVAQVHASPHVASASGAWPTLWRHITSLSMRTRTRRVEQRTTARNASQLIGAALAGRFHEDDPVLQVQASDATQLSKSTPILLEPKQKETQPSTVHSLVNPSNLRTLGPYQDPVLLRWQHVFLGRAVQHTVKWWSMISPACLPLTTSYMPSDREFQTDWQDYPYTVSVHSDLHSFLLRRDSSTSAALAMLREMVLQRLSQGFQLVERTVPRPGTPAGPDADFFVQHPIELLRPGNFSTGEQICLTTTNQVHSLSYNRQAGMINVKRYIKRLPYSTAPIHYRCCIWPRNLRGYLVHNTTFAHPDPHSYNWTYLDSLVAGYEHKLRPSLRFWRARFVLVPSEGSPPPMTASTGEKLSDEEVRLVGIDRLAELFARVEYRAPNEPRSARGAVLRFLPTTLDPSSSMLDEAFLHALQGVADELSRRTTTKPKSVRRLARTRSLALLASDLRSSEAEVKVRDRLWHRVLYFNTIVGTDLVTWLCKTYADIRSREDAERFGRKLQKEGYLEHVLHAHAFHDGHYFYRLTNQAVLLDEHGEPQRQEARPKASKQAAPSRRVQMSRSMLIDLDPGKKSDRAEVAILHHDLAHNPDNGFNFQIHWLGATARLIEDVVQIWTRTVDRYGLRLVEAPIGQIKDVGCHSPFRAPLPIRLARAPPALETYAHLLDASRLLSDTDKMPEPRNDTECWLFRHVLARYATQADRLFEMALLRKFGFVLDQEASSRYPAHIEKVCSSRPLDFDYTQFVHRSGIAFVQVLGGEDGFLWLHNRLYTSHFHAHKAGAQQKSVAPPDADAERCAFQRFCENPTELATFYADVLAALRRLTR
ncbi:Iml1p [Malassezia vespertilionis]|uniref:Vacuolar membrane-associated protein IML1 n=2 Tax=Malassezia vespertilionis TaxID=2020962 RepID=A0A2N1J802_9BASI|nr:Iml1p [Malassezia vespertilionis]